MRVSAIHVNRFLMVVAAGLGVFSVFVNDVDKVPVYGLLAYVLFRVG